MKNESKPRVATPSLVARIAIVMLVVLFLVLKFASLKISTTHQGEATIYTGSVILMAIFGFFGLIVAALAWCFLRVPIKLLRFIGIYR